MTRFALMLSAAPIALISVPALSQTTIPATSKPSDQQGTIAAARAADRQTAEATDLQAPGAVRAGPQQGAAAEDAIVVTGLRQSLRSAQQIKRNSDGILDAVVAQDIGKLPDNQAAETLARIAGVQVERFSDEANRILIRGLPDVTTTYNGREIFTAELRRVQLQDFPAQALAGIEVYKSGTADIVEAGLAGLVNVRTRRPFDFKGLFVGGGIRGTYNDQTKKYDPNGNILFSDRWQTSIGEIGILANATYAQSQYRNGVRYNNQFITTASPISVISPASAGRGFFYPDTVGLYNDGGKRYRPSGNVALQWKPASNLEIYFDGIYQGYRGRKAIDNLNIPLRGGDPTLSNVTLKDGTTNQAAGFTKTGGNPPEAYRSTQADQTDTYVAAGGAIWHSGRATLSTDFAYEHSKYTAREWSFDTAFASSPQVDVGFDVKGGAAFDIPGFDANNPANYLWRGYFEKKYRAKGAGIQWRGDLVLDTEVQAIPELKFGLRYTNRDASLIQGNRYAYTLPLRIQLADLPVGDLGLIEDPFRGNSQGFTRYLMPSRGGIAGNFEALRQRSVAALQQAVTNNPTDQGYKDALAKFQEDDVPYDRAGAFQAREKSYAAYVQGKYQFDLGAMRVDGVAGVRIVNTDGVYNGLSRITNNGVLTLVPRSNPQNYVDVLPNISMRIRPFDKLQLRAAYTQTRTRPDFGALNPALTITQAIRSSNPSDPNYADPNDPRSQINAFGNGGNPDLKPLSSKNYDVTAEYYLSDSSSISVAAFYRDLFGFISDYTRQVQDPVYGLVEIRRPENAGAGKVKGIEANAQGFLDFLPGPLSGLGVQGNVTYLDGKNKLPASLGADAPLVRITGLSKWTYNAALFYEKFGVTGRVSYNWRSNWVTEYRQATDGGRYTGVGVRAISRLDASLSYDLNKQLTVNVDANNILAKPFENYNNFIQGQTYPVDVRYEGRYFGLGVRFRFGE